MATTRNTCTALALGLFLSTGCACAQPTAQVDYSGLGTSALAKLIAPVLPLASERLINQRVARLLKDEGIPDRHREPADLEKLGFECDLAPATTCRYRGVARFTLGGSNMALAERNRHSTEVVVVVDIAGRPVSMVTTLSTLQ